jgi:hypothetical protein
LLRGGKAVRGFSLLQEAFDAAQDGDVLEVRSDAVMEGGQVPQGRGALTLRAGPGYRPKLRAGLHVHPGTALTVEGLTFVRGTGLETEWAKDLPLDRQGRVPRLAYCAFDREHDDDQVLTACLFLSRDGSPGEVVRCVTQGALGCRPPKGSHVRVKESLIGMGLYLVTAGSNSGAGPNAGPADCAGGIVELDACALVWPTTGFHDRFALFRFWGGPAECFWITRRCLLQSNANLRMGHTGGRALWTGERNLYRIGPRWAGDLMGNNNIGLASWRALTKSPETGSVEGEPPIADPRRWRLQPGSPASGAGPDVDRIGRPAP